MIILFGSTYHFLIIYKWLFCLRVPTGTLHIICIMFFAHINLYGIKLCIKCRIIFCMVLYFVFTNYVSLAHSKIVVLWSYICLWLAHFIANAKRLIELSKIKISGKLFYFDTQFEIIIFQIWTVLLLLPFMSCCNRYYRKLPKVGSQSYVKLFLWQKLIYRYILLLGIFIILVLIFFLSIFIIY